MTIAVDLGRKANKQTNKQTNFVYRVSMGTSSCGSSKTFY